MKIYDLLGKEVVTLVNGKLNPGTYRVEFDEGILTSAVYFYRLTSGDFTDTKRMLLVKCAMCNFQLRLVIVAL